MLSNESVAELMLQWEQARQHGAKPTPEELCAGCPQLVEELRRRIHVILEMERVMGVTDDDPYRTVAGPSEGASADSDQEPLPVIPGYDIRRVIGQGGMGVVYEARQIDLGRPVAIKMVSSVRLPPKLKARFQVEAAAAARLQHPHFVQIFVVGEVEGRPYLAMELVQGSSLADLLARRPPDAHAAADLVETLARAVHAAHQRGIVHRDLKPSNILLTADGTPKIADFGLAKLLDDDSSHTHTGEILGTPNYMAPEQAEGNKDQIGPATDVYALGAILYELLAHQPPFRGATPLDSLRLVLAQEPIPPSRLIATIPRDLEAICLKCLEKAPAQRYDSALGLADDLRRFLAGQPVSARRIGSLWRTWKWMRRHPQGVALGAILMLIAFVPAFMLIEHFLHQRRIHQQAVEQAPLVREILHRNCFECHGHDPQRIQKNLNILNHQQLLDPVRRVVVPGTPDDSRLIQRIADGSMPPEEEELRLPRVTERELVILRNWIQGGAPPLPAHDSERPIAPAVPISETAAKTKAIFHEHCYECHKFGEAKGGIKIMHHRLLVTVRKVVIPGRPDQSELFHLLTTPDDDVRMPRPPTERLGPKEIDTIRAWILEGAPPFPKGE